MRDDDGARERWNARHRAAPAGIGPPTDWLLAQADLLAPGWGDRALDVACGRGGDALHLAGLGYAVDALDVSDVAVASVDEAARAAGLALRARRVDVREPGVLEPGAFAVVVVARFLERALFDAIAAALRPGGILVYETFTTAQLDLGWGPRDGRFLLDPGELEEAFATLEVLRCEEGPRPAGGAQTARLVARRPTRVPVVSPPPTPRGSVAP